MNSKITKIGERNREKKKKVEKSFYDFSDIYTPEWSLTDIHRYIKKKLLAIDLEKRCLQDDLKDLCSKQSLVWDKFVEIQIYDLKGRIENLNKYPSQIEYGRLSALYLAYGTKQDYLNKMSFFTNCYSIPPESHQPKSCCNQIDFDVNDDSEYVCSVCGLVQGVRLDYTPEFMSYNDIKETLANCKIQPVYKRSGHLKEKLNQKLVKTKNSIPPDVIDKVKIQLKRDNVKNLSQLVPEDIRKILKKLGLERYYEFDYSIFYAITNIKIIEFDDQLIEKIERMFDQVTEAFNEIENKGRSSLFVYDYTIHKLLELLSLDVYKKHFKPPKNLEKVVEYDRLWKKICEKLNWEFIPTRVV